MHFMRTDELPAMIEEIGDYADDKVNVEIWHDHNNDMRLRVTIHTDPPAVVCVLKWDGPRWRVDSYRPGRWVDWLRAVRVELRAERERRRLAGQVQKEQDEAKRFSPINDDDLFT